MDRMTGVLFQAMSKIDMLFVPYKGAGPSLIDLIAGQVTVGASGLTSSVRGGAHPWRCEGELSRARFCELDELFHRIRGNGRMQPQ